MEHPLFSLKQNDRIRLTNVGPTHQTLECTILTHHLYRRPHQEWKSWEGRGPQGELILLEASAHSPHEELEIVAGIARYPLASLQLTAEFLEECDLEEDGEFTFQKKRFYYRDSAPVHFYRHDEGLAQELHYYEFVTADEQEILMVERYQEDFTVVHSFVIRPSDLQLLEQEVAA